MRRNPFLAGILSLIVPGLGQIYCGKSNRGAAILVAAIIVGNLNILFVPVFLMADLNPGSGGIYLLLRIGHDVMSFWSIVFWIWAVLDAYFQAKVS